MEKSYDLAILGLLHRASSEAVRSYSLIKTSTTEDYVFPLKSGLGLRRLCVSQAEDTDYPRDIGDWVSSCSTHLFKCEHHEILENRLSLHWPTVNNEHGFERTVLTELVLHYA